MLKTKLERKIVVFDLDSALLQEDFLDVCARNFNFSQALSLLRQIDQEHLSILARAASFMRGRKVEELMTLTEEISLVDDVVDIVDELKSKSCIVGTISNGYQVVADKIGDKINADFILANGLNTENDVITGGFSISHCFLQSKSSTCRHRVCKTNALHYLCNCYDIPLANCIVIGDIESDACLIKHAGHAVSIGASDNLLNHVLMAF